MDNSQVIISGLTPIQLIELFRPMLQQEIAKLKDERTESLLSPAEACKLFNPPITRPTLKAWTDKRLLQDHRIGGRVFYKRSEILDSLQTLKKYKAV